MFEVSKEGLRLLLGRFGLDITSGYRAPTKPAIADGRIVPSGRSWCAMTCASSPRIKQK